MRYIIPKNVERIDQIFRIIQRVNQRANMKHILFGATKTALFLAIIPTWCGGCALFGGGGDDVVTRSTEMKAAAPPHPFKKIHVSSADRVWQSANTGNTIALNSMCQKYTDVSLPVLQNNMLEGVDDVKVVSSQTLTFQGRDAQRVKVRGKTDGVIVMVDLLTFKKNNCNYDLAYITRETEFEKEKLIFETFLKGFHVP
jgi:hypothetical protein